MSRSDIMRAVKRAHTGLESSFAERCMHWASGFVCIVGISQVRRT